jgi:ATPases involved in chromosome partitioning
MAVVSVLSLKGGVGKTSVVLGLAGSATVQGLATLVVDLDPQGNATSLLKSHKPRTTVADVLGHPTKDTVEAALTPCDWEVAPGEVDVLPGHPNTIRFDSWTGGPWRPKLSRALGHLDEGYDLVLIDCPPSLGALTREALAASDLALVVTTPSYFGAQGVERAMAEIDEVRKTHNPDLQLAGIVVNRVRSVAEEHQYREHELVEIYGRSTVLKPLMPERIAVQQAEGTGQPVQLVRTAGGREVAEIYDSYLTKLLKLTR